MRIAIIGGVERTEPLLARLAKAAGHEVLFHRGAVGARGVRSLERVIDQADLVIVVTDVNSHGAVRLARRFLRERGRVPVLLRRCGTARLAEMLDAIGTRRGQPRFHAA
ncbi:MAG TPA: DUF2325 domain-containing protein [Anaeromyxobacteraceae bacterium]|nr:DUF2325 domain-containing protein [Anaeromyxobacteraceae bacterium]